MRFISARIAVICLASAAGCQSVPPQPPVVTEDGMLLISLRTSQKIVCDNRPISLDGDRTELTLVGPCHFVRISGSHNDIALDIIPAGTMRSPARTTM